MTASSTILYATALSVAATTPSEGTLRTTVELNGKGQCIQVLWNRSDSSFGEVKEKAETKADVRHGAKVLGTERLIRGRWRVVAMGDNCPL